MLAVYHHFQMKDYLTGQSLILLHHFLILLVNTEHLTDPVGSRLCLRRAWEHYDGISKVILFPWYIYKKHLFKTLG